MQHQLSRLIACDFRRRPVITVVNARPMDEVGFRDVRVATPVSPEAPKVVPPMPKDPPVGRPFLPANNNKTAFEPDPMPVVHQRPGVKPYNLLFVFKSYYDLAYESLLPMF